MTEDTGTRQHGAMVTGKSPTIYSVSVAQVLFTVVISGVLSSLVNQLMCVDAGVSEDMPVLNCFTSWVAWRMPTPDGLTQDISLG